MTTYSPDNTIANLKNALANIAITQIPTITRPYVSEPDGPPEDGSIVVGVPKWRVTDDYSGKLQVELKFPVRYCVIRRGDGEDIVKAESYFLPLMLAYSSWVNQNLDTDAYITEITDGGVTQIVYALTVVRAAVVNVVVKTEFNIPLS